MKLIGDPPRSTDDWDVPLPDVQQEIAALVLRESQARHAAVGNVDEVIADGEALLLVTRPDVPVTTESGSPEWDTWLATRIAECDAAWAAAHTKRQGGAS